MPTAWGRPVRSNGYVPLRRSNPRPQVVGTAAPHPLHHPVNLAPLSRCQPPQYTQTAYAVQYCTDVLTEILQIPCGQTATAVADMRIYSPDPLGTKPCHTAFSHGFFRRGGGSVAPLLRPQRGQRYLCRAPHGKETMRFRFFLSLSEWGGVRIGHKKKLETEIMRARIVSNF